MNFKISDTVEEHEPCPFCGGTDVFYAEENGRARIVCNTCDAEGPGCIGSMDEFDVWQKWNERKPEAVDPLDQLQACRDCGHVGQDFQYIRDEFAGDGDVHCGECGSPRTDDVQSVTRTLALRVDELEAAYERMPRGQDLGIEGAFAGNQPWGFEL